jgi:hypothetical protein
VGSDVESRGAGIAISVSNASADLDLGGGVVNGRVTAGRQPVLGGNMTVLKEDRRQTRNGVVHVSNTELAAGLGRHEVGKDVVAHTRRSIRVDVNGEALSAKRRGRESGDSTAQGVTRGDDSEGRVGGNGLVESGGGVAGDFIPGIVEAVVDFAARSEAAVCEGEDNVCDEVAEVVAAADGEDDQLVCAVDGDEAANASHLAARVIVSLLISFFCLMVLFL